MQLHNYNIHLVTQLYTFPLQCCSKFSMFLNSLCFTSFKLIVPLAQAWINLINWFPHSLQKDVWSVDPLRAAVANRAPQLPASLVACTHCADCADAIVMKQEIAAKMQMITVTAMIVFIFSVHEKSNQECNQIVNSFTLLSFPMKL